MKIIDGQHACEDVLLKRAAVLTCRLSHISWLYVILWISVGELRYNA